MPARREKKEKILIPNPDLQAAMKGWQPEFGDESDKWILESMKRLDKKLREVDNKVLRSGENLTSKMQDILRTEKGLIDSITRRKMDF